MAKQRPWNLFSLVDDIGAPVRRLPLSQPLQINIDGIFREQFAKFFADEPDEVPFDVRLNPDESEIFFISGFELPQAVWDAIGNPSTAPRVEADEKSLESTRGLFTGDEGTRQVLFQIFDRRRLLSTRGFTILLSGGTFKRLEDPGLTLDNQLAAAFVKDRLFFRSYYVARRLFDLSKYFREATDGELELFSRHQALAIEDYERFKSQADSWVRKKVALILESRVLDNQPSEKIAKVAQGYGVDMSFNDRGKIIFPEDKREMKQLLRLLEENFFTSDLTGSRYVSNSKRRLTS